VLILRTGSRCCRGRCWIVIPGLTAPQHRSLHIPTYEIPSTIFCLPVIIMPPRRRTHVLLSPTIRRVAVPELDIGWKEAPDCHPCVFYHHGIKDKLRNWCGNGFWSGVAILGLAFRPCRLGGTRHGDIDWVKITKSRRELQESLRVLSP
jgi:hypothetical protein